jgi:hypothetical protein
MTIDIPWCKAARHYVPAIADLAAHKLRRGGSLLFFAGIDFKYVFDTIREHSQGRLLFQWPLMMTF